jgi:hypothetical protein
MSPKELLKQRPDLPWWTELLVAALISLATAIYLDYTHNDKATAQRVTAVEARIGADEKRQDTAEQQQKEDNAYLRSRVDAIYGKLLDWEKK